MQESNSLTDRTDSTNLIDQCRNDYEKSLLAIENDVSKLIAEGKDMRATMLFMLNVRKILAVHEMLTDLYSALYAHRDVLKHFNSSKLKSLGFELQAPYKEVLESRRAFDGSVLNADAAMMEGFEKKGFKREHWFIRPRILTEIEYMLHCLKMLVEPDFVPLTIETSESSEDSRQDRHIPSSVKMFVWRRDEGKCVSCGSKERLEYDHIIPVSKGGSNTERNIQLLCQNCNRQKSAKIQ